MNLFLYSGGEASANRRMSRELERLRRGKPAGKAVYIPAEGKGTRAEFREFQRALRPAGFRSFRLITLARPLSARAEAALLAADAIFLGGGNTFSFLESLRARGLLPKLRAYARRGGILLGLSAGSILLTPRIKTAEVPSLDKDENENGLRDLGALGLVGFEFSPHYVRSVRVDRELLEYSLGRKRPIFACADGQGIVVQGSSLRLVGKVTAFYRGRKLRSSSVSRLPALAVKSSPNAAPASVL